MLLGYFVMGLIFLIGRLNSNENVKATADSLVSDGNVTVAEGSSFVWQEMSQMVAS